MIDHYRPIVHQEQIDLITVLFKQYEIKASDEAIKDMIACVDFKLLTAYMQDIGIIITHDALGISTSISTVNDDRRWMRLKLQILWNHFK